MAEKAKQAEVEATEAQAVEVTEVKTAEVPVVSEAQANPEKFLKDFKYIDTLISPIRENTIKFYEKICTEKLPTPSKFHYRICFYVYF